MAEQSHREEMSAAIRAQRERHAAPKTIAPDPPKPAATDKTPPAGLRKRVFVRWRGQ